MPYTKAKADAYEKAEEAISALLESFGSFDNGEMLTGWTLIISGSRFSSTKFEEDNVEPDDDEMNSTAHYCFHTRRGQDPTMTRGMVEEFLDKYRSI